MAIKMGGGGSSDSTSDCAPIIGRRISTLSSDQDEMSESMSGERCGERGRSVHMSEYEWAGQDDDRASLLSEDGQIQ